MQFGNVMSCLECERIKQETNKKKEYESFLIKYNKLINSSFTLEAKQIDLMNTLSQLVPCIGCRTSVERFYKQLTTTTTTATNQKEQVSQVALDPFCINLNGNLTVNKSIMLNAKSFYELFYSNW
jgi:hypothetical protein